MAGTPETAFINTGANAMANAITHATIHSANPAGTGGSRTDAGAVAVNFTNTNGSLDLDAAAAFTGAAANAGATHVGFWNGDPAAAGVLQYSGPLTGDQTFNAAGEYTVDTYSIDLVDGD